MPKFPKSIVLLASLTFLLLSITSPLRQPHFLESTNHPTTVVINNCHSLNFTSILACSQFRTKTFKLSSPLLSKSSSKYKLIILSLLLLAGDLEVNPGPTTTFTSRQGRKIKYLCGNCSRECVSDCICCDNCNRWFHIKC